MLWNGTAASAVDLNPAGAFSSSAVDVLGSVQVGVAAYESLGDRAMMWTGTAASAVDLHPAVQALGLSLIESQAQAIIDGGVILGQAKDASQNWHAVVWTPFLPGDFDGNSLVNHADLQKWMGDFGVNGASDGNGDGRTDGADFLVWQRNLGASGIIAAVPEPAAAALAVISALALLAGRRRACAERDALVVDVHTDPTNGEVLEQAVGNCTYLVAAIDSEDDRMIYVGPAYSYYEFRQPADARLTDQEWQRQLQLEKEPPRPAWTADFQPPKLKRGMGN
jgi:hypothetical protein